MIKTNVAMGSFQPSPFRSNFWIRGGHLQTILSIRPESASGLSPRSHFVEVSDGDRIILHEDSPPGNEEGAPCVMFVHGLSGCYSSPYMQRFALRFLKRGFRVFRVDMRGCGAGAEYADHLTHAGRSQDLMDAMNYIATKYKHTELFIAGISLGGAQLLRAVGRVGACLEQAPTWFPRLKKVAAVAPPIDLIRCSDHMQKLKLRLYNYYFIRSLLKRLPKRLQSNAAFQKEMQLPRPRTLRELDDRFTAPLSGFKDAMDYYQKTSCNQVTAKITVPTLVLASRDDPIVPSGCFTEDPSIWSKTTHVMLTEKGGHAGYIGPNNICWMDEIIEQWLVGSAH